jgi:hypothetical protein
LRRPSASSALTGRRGVVAPTRMRDMVGAASYHHAAPGRRRCRTPSGACTGDGRMQCRGRTPVPGSAGRPRDGRSACHRAQRHAGDRCTGRWWRSPLAPSRLTCRRSTEESTKRAVPPLRDLLAQHVPGLDSLPQFEQQVTRRAPCR